MTKEVEHALSRVARRQGLGAILRTAFVWTCVLSALFAVWILGGRLLALWPDVLPAWTVLLLPVVGLGIGFLANRRSDLASAARVTDDHLATEDLFLASLDVDRAPGEFRQLVEHRARAEAGRVRPGEIVPLPFLPRAAITAGALALLWLAHAFLPQLDPFGAGEERMLLGQRAKRLAEEKKATEERKKALAKKALDDRNSADVGEALKEVVKTFKAMRPDQQKKNETKLKAKQAEIGTQWRAARSKQLEKSAGSNLQNLGRLADQVKMREWANELSSGSTQPLRSELKELSELLDKLRNAKDAAQAEKLRKELQDRTRDLSEFLKRNAGSAPLNETLQKALNQLQAMGNPKLAKDAAKALEQSFALTEMELKALAQSVRDMKDLEKAMKALQAARSANEKGQCDGEGVGKEKGKDKGKGDEPGLGAESGQSQAEALEEYRKFFESLAQGEGEEEGPGMGGPGRGRGGLAPEDPSQKNQFKTEKSRSALTAGKHLMDLKTKEAGDRGEVKQEYARSLNQVKQGVDESILQERVPPGYHENIRKYFDDLDKSGAAKPKSPGSKGNQGTSKGK